MATRAATIRAPTACARPRSSTPSSRTCCAGAPRRPAASTDAVNAGKAERNSRGTVALSFVIGQNGKARDVKVVKSSIENEIVEQCVVSKIEEIDFGDVPIDLDWSHTYAFESN